ncbi:MAG: carboxypeptidase-like regulatory domain-containing protein [Bernardetiaceae bacterium]|jgi:hypothetical protein|nr:carboxypeptidase-like regulatory domain-containing protein [Bernardetiaceae bacterium]
MQRLHIFCLWLLLTGVAQAQTPEEAFGRLSGLVVDADNQKPLPFANVFVSNSLLGTSTNERGFFQLKQVPVGAHEIVISFIGYEPVRLGIKVAPGDNPPLALALKTQSTQLDEVAVRPKTNAEIRREVRLKARTYKVHLATFGQYFLGATANARDCEIINPEVLVFTEEKNGVFRVKATDLIEVDNRALGYKIKFLLDDFVVYGKEQGFRYVGRSFFDTLAPRHAREAQQWQKQRLATYQGSLRHFFRALAQNRLSRNGFRVMETVKTPEGDQEVGLFDPKKIWRKGLPGENYIHFEKPMRIDYVRRTIRQNGMTYYPTSWLKMNVPLAVFYDNGNVQNPLAFTWWGEWGNQGLADSLPFEYQPPTPTETPEPGEVEANKNGQ